MNKGTAAGGMRKLFLARRLREAILAIECANKLLDDELLALQVEDLPELTEEERLLMADLVMKVNELVGGYEEILPKAV